MRVLVTGGAGFIGSHLASTLVERGFSVRILDNFATGRRSNLRAIGADAEVIEGDIQSYERVNRAVAGCDVVFHQGALPSVPRSIQDPLTSHATNVIGTLNVLLASRDHGVRRVVVASSSSVYGANKRLPKREDDPALPISPYATAKLASENYARSFHAVYGLETVVLRYFNVFGPRQDPTSQYSAVVPRFIATLLGGGQPVIFGDGEQSRDFTAVANVVDANLLAMDAPGAAGRVYNVACGEQVSVNRLAQEIGELLEVEARAGLRRAAGGRGGALAGGPRACACGSRLLPLGPAPRGLGDNDRLHARARARGLGRPVARRLRPLSGPSQPVQPPASAAVEPTRVVRVIARLNIGGPSIQAITLTRRLEPLGYLTTLVRGREGEREGNMDDLAAQLEVRPVFIPTLQRDPGRHDLHALRALVAIMRRERPHVVHTHAAKAGTLGRVAALLAAAGRRRRPVMVHTFHGHSLSGYFAPRTAALYRMIERVLARFTDRLIAVSQEVRDELVGLGVAPAQKFEVVPLGLDLAPFALDGDARRAARARCRAELGIDSGATLVTLIARLAAIKRVDRFLSACLELRDLEHVRFVVVGDGQLRDELQSSPEARALAGRLVWAGFRRDIPEVCVASDIVVLTSDREGTPVSLIEASAAAVPTVSTAVGGAATVIRSGETGILVEREDGAALVRALRQLIADPELRARMGAAAREHALSTFGLDRLTLDIDRIYRELLAARDLS